MRALEFGVLLGALCLVAQKFETTEKSGTTPRELLGRKKKRKKMAEFEKQLKERARELKTFFKKGVKIVGDSCKKGWYKVRHMRG